MFSRRKRTPRSQSQRPQTAPGKPQAPGHPPEFYGRQATRTVRSRTFWLMLVMGILVFVILFFQLYHLQITRHKELQTKALDQQTRQTVVSAFRGTIYDRNGSQLAVSVSTEDVVMSPYHMKKQLDDEAARLEKIRLENAQLKKGETPQSEDTTVLWDYDSLAASLADILGISQDDVRERMNNTDSQYELLAKKVDEDTANQIRQLINDLKVEGLDLTATSKRVYPYGSLASHVLGFVGTDNTGLYGLESRYDKYLQGQTGLVVTAKDERGNPLPYEYEQYFAAQNGQDLVLTLDANVQYYLEKYVGEMADKYGAENGATGIVMDVKTGGVLGMVSYPTYDLNNAFTVQNDLFKKNLTDTSDQLLKQWRNDILEGKRSMAEALRDPNGRKLTSFIGMGELRHVDYNRTPIHLLPGDRVLLMSDGVYGTVSDAEMAAILRDCGSVQLAASHIGQRIMGAALPYQDNYTLIVLGYDPPDQPRNNR